MMAPVEAQPDRGKGRLLRLPTLAGGVMAPLFLAASLVPSLLPRPWFVQGIVSGFAIALGVGLGSGLAAIPVRTGGRARGTATARTAARILRIALVVAGAGAALVSVWLHHRWQADVRRLMGMDGNVTAYLAAVLVLGPLLGAVLVVAARSLRRGFRGYVGLLSRAMPHQLALAAGIVTVMVSTVVVFDVVVADRLLAMLDDAYRASDRTFDAHVSRPDSQFRAGGPGSLISWESMGRQGRAFVAQGPRRADLERFHHGLALEPIRVYAGLESASSARARAELAVSDLERAGAFDRELIVLIAPTGSGWIDPYAVDPLEYLYRGDTAAVAIQYSYLPSWVVMIGNQDLAMDAGRALFEAVHARIAEEPESSRPRLLLYGESLGSFGLERIFDGVDDIRARADGVLWVGPPRSNRLWQRFTAQRDAGTPVWRPIYRGGEAVRFGPDGDRLSAPGAIWNAPRIVYLQHPSDPITWWTPSVMFERPDWMDEPRGPDVSSLMPYVPIVTFWQMGVDLAMGTNAPIGHGHKFGLAQAEAWALIIPPVGWSEEDTTRLLAAVEQR